MLTGAHHNPRALVEVRRIPYLHFVIPGFYSSRIAVALHEWMSTGADWTRTKQSFYDQYELSFWGRQQVPEELAADLLAPNALGSIRALATDFFGIEFQNRISVTAHKMIRGQYIGIHTDSGDGGHETHRILVQLPGRWDPNWGGELVLLESPQSGADYAEIVPEFNTAIAFALGDESYHSVNEVTGGERLTVIYGLWSGATTADARIRQEQSFEAR